MPRTFLARWNETLKNKNSSYLHACSRDDRNKSNTHKNAYIPPICTHMDTQTHTPIFAIWTHIHIHIHVQAYTCPYTHHQFMENMRQKSEDTSGAWVWLSWEFSCRQAGGKGYLGCEWSCHCHWSPGWECLYCSDMHRHVLKLLYFQNRSGIIS